MLRQQFGPDYRADLDLIFASHDGTPLKSHSVSTFVSALCRRLKLPEGASLHILRPSHGSYLIASGGDLQTASARPGHSNVRVSAEFYAHVLRGRDDERARKRESSSAGAYWKSWRRASLNLAGALRVGEGCSAFRVSENMVALTGIEPDGCEVSPV